MKTRYDNLNAALKELADRGEKHLRYLEVGTYDGHRAASLVKIWKAQPGRLASYFGFDLWEDLTPEKSKAEFSKSRLPPAMATARETIQKAGATVSLRKGDTRQTLPAFVEEAIAHGYDFNLIYIDGGHSLETIDSDWAALSRIIKPETVVLLDDYWVGRDDLGCKTLIDRLSKDPTWETKVLDPVDHIPHNGLSIHFARVKRKEA